jgi:butyrate kinase
MIMNSSFVFIVNYLGNGDTVGAVEEDRSFVVDIRDPDNDGDIASSSSGRISARDLSRKVVQSSYTQKKCM